MHMTWTEDLPKVIQEPNDRTLTFKPELPRYLYSIVSIFIAYVLKKKKKHIQMEKVYLIFFLLSKKSFQGLKFKPLS